ncbi:MAG TPA: ROK family protein [Terriglobia bacterium]|nr:ROK family protein [Terriglobia bacterium]
MRTVKKRVIAGIDLGGTSMKVLIVDARNSILGEARAPTRLSRKPSGILGEIAETLEEALAVAGLKRRDLTAVSIGAPGSIDRHRGVVHEAPNLGWTEFSLGPQLERRVRVPVLVDNDVNVGTVGEHILGAGAGTNHMVGIFVGTGIGGGIIANGRLYEGSVGGAGEIGHTVIQKDGPLCSCGNRGCAEALASRWAMERDVRAAIKAGHKSIVLDLMKKKGKPRMTSSIMNSALKRNDRVMRDVLKHAEYCLGILAANVVNLLDPECVVIGGGIATRLGERFVAPIREAAAGYFLREEDAQRIRVVAGRLGDDAGALGAVVLARQRLGIATNPKQRPDSR